MYALLMERITQNVASERQVAATLIAAGVKDVALPTYEQARTEFDLALFAEPKAVRPEDQHRQELLEALGVR